METTGSFDGALTHDLHITSQTCNPLSHATTVVSFYWTDSVLTSHHGLRSGFFRIAFIIRRLTSFKLTDHSLQIKVFKLSQDFDLEKKIQILKSKVYKQY